MTDDRFSYATPRDAQTAKRIAVSGGAGFLGSHLCGRLIDAGHHVTCIDNFHTGRHANVAHLMSSDRFHLVAQDINEPLDEAQFVAWVKQASELPGGDSGTAEG